MSIKVWSGAFVRGLVVAGISFFSVSLSTAAINWSSLQAALLTGGVYMFAELIKFYKISIPAKKAQYKFLLFP